MSKKELSVPIVKFKGIPIVMDGEVYVVPPLSLGAMEQMQERLDDFEGGTDPKSIRTVIDATHEALKRNYPNIERDFIAENLDLGNMDEFMRAVMDVSGMNRKAIESANEAVGGEMGES